jgi:hypothetical protein
MRGFTWEDKISDARLKELAGLGDINRAVMMECQGTSRQMLKWMPQGHRSRGRPGDACTRTYETELKVANI